MNIDKLMLELSTNGFESCIYPEQNDLLTFIKKFPTKKIIQIYNNNLSPDKFVKHPFQNYLSINSNGFSEKLGDYIYIEYVPTLDILQLITEKKNNYHTRYEYNLNITNDFREANLLLSLISKI